ncbi:MAG: isoprenylcysteine carboxylmethyltransferase family protein [Marinicellaceae bacterium]
MNNKNHAQVKTIPPLIPLFFILISWLVNKYIFNISIPVPTDIQTYIAYFFMACATFLFGFSLLFFFKSKQNPEPHTPTNALYTSGVFRITRNPIYLGFLAAQIVVAIKFNNLYIILSLPLVVVMLNKWVIEPEEVYLEKLFGDKYLEYKKSVRRWI